MSATTVVMIAEGGLLAVLILFVVALLRSHAEILRRLAALEPPAVEGRGRQTGPDRASAELVDLAPTDLVGETLDGGAVTLSFAAGPPRTLLAFLSSGCSACGRLWNDLRDGAALPSGTRLVVVTKGPERESPSRLAALGPVQHDLLMSTDAWHDFAVPATPHFVLVDAATRRILGRGAATSWEQILTLVQDADRDSTPSSRPLASPGRAARAEQTLARSGVTEGHPSLYPSGRADGGVP